MEEILKLFKAFISFLTSTISLGFSSSSQNPPPLPTPAPLPLPLPPAALIPDNDQLEMIIPIDPTSSSNNSNNSSSSNRDDQTKHQGLPGKMIIEFCFTTAIALLVLSYQNQNDAHHYFLSFSFHILYLSILLAFSTSWGGILLRLRYPSSAKVLEQMGIMFAALAFFLAMEISVPPSLKWVTWLISAFSLLFLFIHYIYSQKDLVL